jgi:hypothetical protein
VREDLVFSESHLVIERRVPVGVVCPVPAPLEVVGIEAEHGRKAERIADDDVVLHGGGDLAAARALLIHQFAAEIGLDLVAEPV